MGDIFLSYSELKAKYRNDIDYLIQKYDRGGRILILAPHGGGIERGTSELAKAIAGDELSLYLFEGLMPLAHQSKDLHITSARFDEPECLELTRGFQTSLAIHGCIGKEPMIYVGGKDCDLKDKLISGLSAKGRPVKIGTGSFAGTLPTNICNCTQSGRGVQLEFSNGLRRLLFEDWQNRNGRKHTTELFSKLVAEIRTAIGII